MSRPRTQTVGLRAQAWWVIRKSKSITLAELMLTICDGTEKNPTTNLRCWLNPLVSVGILSRQRVNDGILCSNGSYRYSLVKDVGSKAPVLRQLKKEVFDPNNGEVFHYD
jgi:hypothetical protein